MRKLTVYIPGLFGSDMSFHSDDLPDTPALNWMISKAHINITESTSPVYTLCHFFGLDDEQGEDLPIAALSRLNDDNQFPEGCWLRADPVHAVADRDSLILFDHNRFSLNQHDALALAADINKLLETHDLKLEVPVPHRWYVKIPDSYNLITTPIGNVIGKNILPFMPIGDNADQFIKLMNEIQMVLHNSDINQKREQEKMLPINSIWFWGSGSLPEMIKRKWSFVVSDEPVAKGLATISATHFKQLPEHFDHIDKEQTDCNGLIVINEFEKFMHYNEYDDWKKILSRYEDNWFLPLLSYLKSKQLDQLEIKTDSMLVSLNNLSRYKFWKQTKHLTSLYN